MTAMVRERVLGDWRLLVPFTAQQLAPLYPNEALRRRFNEGVYWVRSGGEKPSGDLNSYGRQVRDLFHLAAGHIPPYRCVVDLVFILTTTAQVDDDAWTVIAKYAVDGLTDAGLWKKDRRAIRWIRGKVERIEAGQCSLRVDIGEVTS